MRGKQDSQTKEKRQDEATKGLRGLNNRQILAQLWRRVFPGQLVCATCRAYPLRCYRGLTAHKFSWHDAWDRVLTGVPKRLFTEKRAMTYTH